MLKPRLLAHSCSVDILRLVDQVIMYVVNVDCRDAKVFATCLGCSAVTWWQYIVGVPGKDLGEGGTRSQAVVLERDIQGNVEERLAIRFNEGGETVKVQSAQLARIWYARYLRCLVCFLLRRQTGSPPRNAAFTAREMLDNVAEASY